MSATLEVKVDLLQAGFSVRLTATSPYNLVVDWFKQLLPLEAKMLHVEVTDVRFDLIKECVVISYTRLPDCDELDFVIADMLADPDDNCNYPIVIDGVSYIVMGTSI